MIRLKKFLDELERKNSSLAGEKDLIGPSEVSQKDSSPALITEGLREEKKLPMRFNRLSNN